MTQNADGNFERKRKCEDARSSFPNLTQFKDVDADPRKDWLVHDFLGDGELSCGFGAPGTSKSAITIDLAAHIAAGLQWFSRPVNQGSVLYVALERRAVVLRRLAAWRKRHGIDDIPLAVLAGQYDLRSSTAGADEIIKAAEHLARISGSPIRFIPIETVSRALAGGDENAPKDMGALVNNLTRIMDATGAHILVTHHIPADGSQRLRGHGALLGAVDTTFKVEKAGTLYTATIDKTNDGPEGERLAYALVSVDLHSDPKTGITTTAPIVEPHDGQLPKPAPRQSMTDRQKNAMTALHHIAAETGKPGPADLPGGIVTVTSDAWREELYRRGDLDREAANPRQDFSRLRQQLKSRHLIGERDGLVWAA